MIDTYDVKASMRESDKIWESYNKLSIGKQTGGIGKSELSDLLINIGDVFANQIRQGKVNEDTIESYKTYLTQFLGSNKDKFFSFPHDGLDRAAKTNFEGIEFAKEALEERNLYSKPSMSQEERDSYTKGFRKLG